MAVNLIARRPARVRYQGSQVKIIKANSRQYPLLPGVAESIINEVCADQDIRQDRAPPLSVDRGNYVAAGGGNDRPKREIVTRIRAER